MKIKLLQMNNNLKQNEWFSNNPRCFLIKESNKKAKQSYRSIEELNQNQNL